MSIFRTKPWKKFAQHPTSAREIISQYKEIDDQLKNNRFLSVDLISGYKRSKIALKKKAKALLESYNKNKKVFLVKEARAA